MYVGYVASYETNRVFEASIPRCGVDFKLRCIVGKTQTDQGRHIGRTVTVSVVNTFHKRVASDMSDTQQLTLVNFTKLADWIKYG